MGVGTRVRPAPVTSTAPTAAANADAVWDEQKAGHVAANSFGKIVQDTETDVGAVQTSVSKVIHSTEVFWSTPIATVSITNGNTSPALTDITLPNLTIGTIVRAVAFLMWGDSEDTSAALNAINGASNFEVQKSGGPAWTSAITIVDNTIETPASSRRGGYLLPGTIDVSSVVDALNQVISGRFTNIKADGNMELHDVVWGVKVFYTV